MKKNFGRDISKFFYGGYAMVGGTKVHRHSPNALAIAKQLVVGKLDLEPSLNDDKMRITAVTPVNNTTSTFLFRLKNEQKVKGLKKWYGNVNMIGRHFVVSSDDALEEKRHYTICNIMQPAVL